MSYVTVTIDISEIDTDDMVYELEKRWKRLSKEQKKKVKPYLTETEVWEPSNLDHRMKFELFLKHVDDYFYTEFEKRIASGVDYIEDRNRGNYVPVIKI